MAVTPGPPMVRRAAIRGTALLALLGLWASSATAASPWIEITSEDFVLVTNLTEKKARTLLRDFEVFQYGASRLLAGEDTQPKIPTYLFALSSRDFEAIVDSKDLAGLFVGRPFANYVLYDHGQRGVRGREVVFHEYLHFLLHNSPGFIYPAWYNEGIAEVYSTITERDGAIEFGRIPTDRVYTIVNSGLIPTEQILNFDYRSPEFRGHRLIPQFYAQAWLMTHYFFIGNPPRGQQLKKYLAEINAGATTAEATLAAFGVEPAELHREIKRYWDGGKIPLKRIRFGEPLPTVEAAPLRTLPNSKAQALLGYVTLRAQRNPQRATRFFERALKEDPAETLALAGMAAVSEAAGKADEATALLERALSQPLTPASGLLAADLLLRRASQALEKSELDAEARATGRRARDLYGSLLADPVARDEASFGFARAAMLLDKPEPDEVLAVIRPATAHLPTNTNLAQVEALLALRTGENQLALDAATRAARYANSFEERKSMQSLLDWVEKRIAEKAR